MANRRMPSARRNCAQYFLYLKNEKRVSPSGFKIALCGIKFFYERTLRREWELLDLARPDREKKLPVVLSREEVRRILRCVRRPRYQVCLSTIYGCGLRRQEGVSLHVQDIDSARMLVHVRHGKGAKDRYVPLPAALLPRLRQFWCTHRHPVWLFPSPLPPPRPSRWAGGKCCGSSRAPCGRAG